MKAYKEMLKTELKLSLRGMDMLIFAVIMPIVVLVALGIIYGNKPASYGAEYTFVEQSFGALASIAICAGGVMGLPLVISDYRSKHILKRYQVTPVKPSLLLFVQVTIYMLYALVSLLSLFVISMICFDLQIRGSILKFLLGWLLVMFSLFSLGLMVGGIAKNAKIAGVLASALYFPMLIFSGATLPYEVMPSGMQKVVDVMPLTQGIKILKSSILGLSVGEVLIPICLLVVLALVCLGISIRFFKWE